MKKTFVKMNNSDKHLSLGNLCRLIKETSKNKILAGQSEIFYALFEDDLISDSAINNYCIGYRDIGKKYKKIYSTYEDEYKIDPKILNKIIINIISILEGRFDSENLNVNNQLFKKLCLNLYNIAKNDNTVSNDFTKKIYEYIKNNELEKAFSEILFFIILEKKQPIYIENINKEIFESLLNNTDISMNELEKFLKLQLNDGINYFYKIKTLAKEENPYACFELGEMEYNGQMTGYSRYIKSYEYLKIAASKNHPRANWLIAQMFLNEQLGNKTEEDLELAFNYLKKAESLGSVAALNTLGLFYLNRDKSLAITYFEKAAKFDYVYAYNNLGKIYEENKDYQKAFDYYLTSANLEESWACNKVGQFYRTGKAGTKNLEKAFHYYTLALNVPSFILEYWAMFNLAKFFYLNGCYSINLEADKDKAISLFETAAAHGINEAIEELIYLYINEFKKTHDDKLLIKINNYLEKLSKTPHYEECKKKIEKKLLELENEYYIITKK